MAFMTEIQGFESGLVHRMRTEFDRARERAGKRRMYRDTLRELRTMSARSLDDMGLAQSNLADVAWTATYGE